MAKFDITNGFLREVCNVTGSGTSTVAMVDEDATAVCVDLKGVDAINIDIMTQTVTDAGTASGFTFQIEESDDTTAANFTAVADADLVGLESLLAVTADTDDDAFVGSIGYIGSKRYIRVTTTGTTGTDAKSSIFFTGRAEVQGSVLNSAGTAFEGNTLTLTATS